MQNVIPFNRESFGQLLSKKFLLVIVISIPSAIVADFFKVPLAWMIGPMIATSLIALKGFQVIMPRLALSSILIILGLHIGNYIDQNLLNHFIKGVKIDYVERVEQTVTRTVADEGGQAVAYIEATTVIFRENMETGEIYRQTKVTKQKFEIVNVFSHQEVGNAISYERDLRLKDFFEYR